MPNFDKRTPRDTEWKNDTWQDDYWKENIELPWLKPILHILAIAILLVVFYCELTGRL